MSRALADLGADLVRFGAARSIQYALRDTARGLPDITVYQVNADGRVGRLGVLIPLSPEGFLMQQEDGAQRYSAGLPWWLTDMRPQGYLGRAYAARHAAALGLPPRPTQWSDTHALRALLAHGHDAIGNLLLGETARGQFLDAPLPVAIAAAEKAQAYAALAREAARGEQPGSSAGGEQPKFTCYTTCDGEPAHAIVKFSEAEAGPVGERWRDLLLAEHLALETLRAARLPAARSCIIDHAGQRFLEVLRFDRVGALGRRALISLSALDAEFVGAGSEPWPAGVQRLREAVPLQPDAVSSAALLWAFGSLIGNTDMHGGNLLFIAEHACPYALAPAYDMSPMAFAPRSGGGLPDTLPAARVHASVPDPLWHQAERLARDYLQRLRQTPGFSARFAPCIAALARHIEQVAMQTARLAPQ